MWKMQGHFPTRVHPCTSKVNFKMIRLNPIFFAVCAALISGCAHLKTSQDAYHNQGYGSEAYAEQDELTVQNQQQLNTAAALLASHNPNDAKMYTDAIDPESLSAADLSRLQLLQTQISLDFAETEQATKHLRLVQPALLSHTDKITYFRSRAVVFSLLGKPLESVKARIALQSLLANARQQIDNKSAILETLRLLSAQSLQAQQTTGADELSGWIALARLIKLTPQLDSDDPNLQQWRAQFPKHPANKAFLAAYLGNRQRTPTTIAVFLPESGEYAEAAKAIKAGFMASHMQAEKSGIKPTLHFYDSVASDPLTLYYKAIDAGAQMIIGPLNKEHVEALAIAKTLEVPVLTLNHIPGLNKANLYQFALSPIDEVNQVTNKAIDEGHKKALLLTPKTELGTRVQGYFKAELQKRGGTLLEAKHYNPDISDYSDTIKDLLNVRESQKRYAQLQGLIPDLKFTPRQRQDVEALFITAYPQNAATIQSQLRKLAQAHNIPIYATPQIFKGVSTPSDNDLHNIAFCDMPWVFGAAYQGPLSLQALRTTWLQFPEIYLRLIAMGIDAYNLIPHLNQLKTVPYNGATGKLMLTDENRIQRHLVCAKFNHTQPELLDSYTQSHDKEPQNPPVSQPPKGLPVTDHE
jgi:uncharacterized protein